LALAGAPLGRLIVSSLSFTCEPAQAMKKSMSTNTTSTIGCDLKSDVAIVEPTEPAIN